MTIISQDLVPGALSLLGYPSSSHSLSSESLCEQWTAVVTELLLMQGETSAAKRVCLRALHAHPCSAALSTRLLTVAMAGAGAQKVAIGTLRVPQCNVPRIASHASSSALPVLWCSAATAVCKGETALAIRSLCRLHHLTPSPVTLASLARLRGQTCPPSLLHMQALP